MKWFGPTQFALFRILFGLYLTFHFFELLFVGKEVFSNEGVISNSQLLPGFGKIPLHIFKYDSPTEIRIFLASLVLCSIMFTIGLFRRIVSLIIFYGWISLLNRNPLISNPSLGYIGWILLACALIPKGDRLGFLLTKSQRETEYKNKNIWQVPDVIYYGFWIVMSISYVASGLHKLQCESWLDGTALYYIFTGPLVRKDNMIVKFLLNYPFLIKILTIKSLFLEISFLFLGTFYRTRKSYWIAFMGFHLGILATVNFADLTVGMLLAHLFTFDASWFKLTKELVIKYDHNDNENDIVVYDINHSDNFNNKSIIKLIAEAKDRHIEKSYSYMQKLITISCLVVLFGIILNYFVTNITDKLVIFAIKITTLTIDMYWGFGVIIIVLGALMILERLFPDQELKQVDGWWIWVLLINIFQLFAVVLAAYTWEDWLQNTSYFTNSTGFHLRNYVTPCVGGFLAYVLNQWLFYYWHKARHEVYFLWILFHQFHHSPSRIETITSFYKHPLEIIADSQIMAILLYSVLGLSKESSIWLSIFSAFGEYFYHMNISTPKIIGYFLQRPESHRCHHRRNKRIHCPNYSDFPFWDILGGTFENPKNMNEETGFSHKDEIKRIDMLLLKDVVFGHYKNNFSNIKKIKKTIVRYISYILVVWGCLNSAAFVVHNNSIRDVGFVTVSSPLPLVFSAYNGVQTFATEFYISLKYANNTEIQTSLNVDKYNLLSGAYNRKNIYGAIFSHGPFFDKLNLIKIRESVLNYAVCDPGSIITEFGLLNGVESMHVDILYRPNNTKIAELDIKCKP